jgi:hypothetical protein
MSQSSDADPPGVEETPRGTARRIADEIAPLLRDARAAKFEFLAYLLGMALKEARRLSQAQGGT